MKKSLFVILLVAFTILLGLTVYSALLFYGNSTLPPCCPLLIGQTVSDQLGSAGRSSLGMMVGPGMMNPGMMDAMHVAIESEYDFLVHMIPHHQEAVDTAIYLRANSNRPEMKKFAEDIIKTQSAEIVQMVDWLETWHPDEQHSVAYQPMMRNLENLEGNALDRAFLEDMIPHHMAAVMMSQQLLSRGLAEHAEVAVLARSIRNSQRNEIHMMMQWLASWYSNEPIAIHQNLPVFVLGGLLFLLVFIAFLVLLILLVAAKNKQQGPTAKSSRDILDKRYAKGEISREEYFEIRRNLK